MGLLVLVGLVLWLGVPRIDVDLGPVHQKLDEHGKALREIKGLLSRPVETEVGSHAPDPGRNVAVVKPLTAHIQATAHVVADITRVPPSPKDAP